jgi:hypothetical protein
LFTLGSFSKIAEVTQIFVMLFPRFGLCINFDKNELGYTLGDFFTPSSGHPAAAPAFTAP